jgi:catechol 2,3-dioxygenase
MRIGHLRFKVRDIERAVDFYKGSLQMTLTEKVGDDYAFLSCGVAHHEIALMKVEASGPSPSSESVGFDHVAFELPDRRAFAEAFQRLSKSGVEVTPIDNGISWAMYLADPDGNRIELFCDNREVPGGRLLWGGDSVGLDTEAIQAALKA